VRVRLRRLRAEDAARLLDWRNRAEVAAFMYTDHAITPEEHAGWMRAALAGEGRRDWIVELDDAPVGLANFVRIETRLQRAEWGFYLADPATRGRGVGAALMYLLLRHAFETMGLHKVWSEVLAANAAVWRLHLALGFTREAMLRDQALKGGAFGDVVGLGMLAGEWPAARAAAETRLSARFRLEDLTLEA
jgi:UDP-4-amino-4,6-dideoxy-N-acetyl-beta-L-altrosamine N-acetyltransferase